jgi:hypothetical protein
MWQILCAVTDGEINTPAEASAILAEETAEYARVLQITETEARAQLIANLDRCATQLCTSGQAEKLRELFELGKENV